MSGTDPLADLLARSAEGDDVALGALVRRTQADVWRMCSALGSTGEVDDLVQETYLRMIRALPSFRGDSSVRTWLLAIARHVCADHVRRKVRHRRLLDRLAENLVEQQEPPPTAPTAVLGTVDLDALNAEQREAIVLTQVLDLSYEEASRVLGCPIGTVRSRVHRAREKLLGGLGRAAAG